MFTLHSFLQTLFQFVKALVVNVSKRMYRSAAVLTAGCMVISVVTFSSAGFGGGGRNAMAAYTQIHPEADDEPEEIDVSVFGEELTEDLFVQSEDAEAFEDAAAAADGETESAEELIRFEESGLFAEEAFQESDGGAGMGQSVIGGALEQDTIAKLESGRVIRERVGQAQREMRVQQVTDAAERATEEVRKKEEEERRAALRIPYSEQDYQVMLKIVQAEAGGCDATGKILVANVVMNRVRSKKFPNSVTEVVYQQSQFSPVLDGSINRVKVSAETIECVNRALDGEDYSQGALYFMNRRASQSGNVRWFDGRLTYLFQHGAHEFFK